jgi:hypothetical protein
VPKYRFDELDDEDGDFELPEEYSKTQKIKRGQKKLTDELPKKKPTTPKHTPRPDKI